MAERPTTILHVDDDEANRYAVTRTLTKAGFRVVEAADGAGALRAAVEAMPDLAILDVRLPDITGFDVCRRLKADPLTATIPVLHLSASFIRGQDKAEGLDGGADAYLIRPVEPVELLATVNALLRTRRTEERLREREQELRVQTERLNAALAASNTGTFRYELGAAAFEAFDANLRRLVGLPAASADAVAFDAAVDRVHADDRDAVRRATLGCGDDPDCEIEFRVALDDGGIRWLFGRARLSVDHAGRHYFVGACTDVTARKLVEQAARRAGEERDALLVREQTARAEAERASRMKDEFLATLSHELRTPLSAILGWSQVLRRPSATPETLATGLATIERNARAQTKIIEDLLDMSRIISGKVALDLRPIALADAVRAAIDTVRPTALAKGIDVRFDVPADARHPVLGDVNRLQQVFWNLLSNAIKFTPRGGVVAVGVERHDASWRATIVDDGEGISDAFLPHVFDRFRQADASTTRVHGGLGLGLAIVKQLVELHGGSVTAASAGAGRGSTFAVALPIGDEHAAASLAAPASVGVPEAFATQAPPIARDPPPSDVPASDALRGRRVLVIDDEADARGLLEHVLAECGAAVLVAASTDDAVAIVERDRPDLFVSDIGMPGEDGYALIRRIRALGPARGGAVPAIALTAYARAEDRVRAIRAGFELHLAKPVDPAELIAMAAGLTRRGDA